MTGAALREVAPEPLGVVGVVEDQQPAVRRNSAAQQVDGLLGGRGHVVAALGAEPDGEFGEAGHHIVGLLGRYPPDQVVVGHEAVHVLQGHLGLADAAEPVQGLRLGKDDGHPAAELVAHPLQDQGTASEAGVAGWCVPDLRHGTWEAGTRSDPVDELHRAVQGTHQRRGGVHLVEPEKVDGVAVDVGRGEAYVPDPEGRSWRLPPPGSSATALSHRLTARWDLR